ncbi:MAG TPA: PAS domain S-box protein, partial [Gemmata sp.]
MADVVNTSHAGTNRVRELIAGGRCAVHRRTDRMFAVLLVLQWAGMVVLAAWVSPLTWAGSTSRIHPHVWAAVALGGWVVALPVALVAVRPGRASTRCIVAAAQMLSAGLLIHLTGGRLETHFHVFGSLAFLALYRDWRVLLVASAVTALDHVVRGLAWPESVYGTGPGADWRWLEHAGWVVFTDVFLGIACWWGDHDIRRTAEREAELETARETVEERVRERTAELWQQEERFRSAFDSAAIGMALLSPDGRFTRVNRVLCDLVGYTEAELLARAFRDITHPEDRTGDAECVTRLHSGNGPTYQREKRYVHKNGSVLWVQVNVSMVCDAGGRPHHIVSQILDVTARKRSDEALRASEERYRTLATHSPVGIFQSSATGARVYHNERWCELTGLSADRAAGSGWVSAIHPADRDRVFRSWELVRTGAGTGELEYRFLRPDGETIWVLGRTITLRNAVGAPDGYIGIVTDVSALKHAQAAAEAANRAKGEFLANMSHEIRTPMNGIVGMTELLLETRLSPDQRESVALVKSSADALLTVINDVLDFSKIEAGKLDLDPLPFSLGDMISDTLKALAGRAHAKGLELACEVSPDTPDILLGDARRLRQVLTNLVGNAIKFTDHGEVVVRCAQVPAPGDAVALRFSVTDTGIGIAAHKLASVFEPFTQADGSTTRKYGGTGLGLTICLRLVELMGGRLWAESEAGAGSTFWFEVRVERTRASWVRDTEAPVDLTGVPVLIVDDNATNRRVLAETVRHWGANPTCVASGMEGLDELRWAVVRGAPFPLVLLDGMMPGMDGFVTAERIGRDPELTATAVVMLTSADRQGDAARCRDLGVAAYLVKPVKSRHLNRAIAAALRGTCAVGGTPADSRVPPATGTEHAPPGPVFRVLVAEDNPVNQRVITRLLENFGHTVTMTANGRQALGALAAAPFDVVLMDVQMPEMDGFEATRALRAGEAGTGRRTFVVAMTAHAMKGDRERCLDAGMDDYLSKPIQRSELVRVLDRAAREPVPAPPGPPLPAPGSGDEAPFDRASALARLGGDEELFAEVAGLFQADAQKFLTELREALRADNAEALHRTAHGLKGAAGYLGARPT